MFRTFHTYRCFLESVYKFYMIDNPPSSRSPVVPVEFLAAVSSTIPNFLTFRYCTCSRNRAARLQLQYRHSKEHRAHHQLTTDSLQKLYAVGTATRSRHAVNFQFIHFPSLADWKSCALTKSTFASTCHRGMLLKSGHNLIFFFFSFWCRVTF